MKPFSFEEALQPQENQSFSFEEALPTEETQPVEARREPDLSGVFGTVKEQELARNLFGTPEEAFSFDTARQDQAELDKYAKLEQKAEEQSILREVVDVPLKLGQGFTSGVRFISDFFGADNALSQSMRRVENTLGDLMSAQSQMDSQKVARIMKDAEDKGILDQVIAGLHAFTVAPIDITANALGTSAPTLAAALLTTASGGSSLLLPTTIGVVQGTGITKSAIYDAVYYELKNQGVSDEKAKAVAEEAQAYTGENLDTIVAGGALGGLAGRTGVESGILKTAMNNVRNKFAKQAAKNTGVGEETIKGIMARRMATEAGTEAAQAGEEQLAQNIALQREGFDVPTFRGVASSMALEGTAGGVMAAPFAYGEARARPEAARAREIQRQIDEIRQAREAGVTPIPEEGVEEVVGEPVGQPEPRGPEPSVSVPSGEAAPVEPAPAPTEPTAGGVGVSGVPATPVGGGDAGVGAPLEVAPVEAGVVEPAAVEPAPTELTTEEQIIAEAEAEQRLKDEEAAAQPAIALKETPQVKALRNLGSKIVGYDNQIAEAEGYVGRQRSLKAAQTRANKEFTPLVEKVYGRPLTAQEDVAVRTALQRNEPLPDFKVAPAPTTEPTPTVEDVGSEVASTEGEVAPTEAKLEAAEGVAPKERRGRKKVERTPEEQAAYDADRKARQARLTKANRTAKAASDILNAPLPKPTDFATEGEREQFLAGYMSAAERNLANAFRIQADPELRGTKARKQADEILNNPVLRAPQMQQLRRAAQARAQQDPELEPAKLKPSRNASRITNDKLAKTTRQESLGRFDNGRAVLQHIIKTGNAFERELARRLMDLVADVPVVVVRSPMDILKTKGFVNDPEETLDLFAGFTGNEYKAVYVEPDPDAQVAGGVVYVNDQPDTDQFNNGLNTSTILHELVHAATSLVMNRANSGKPLTRTQAQFVESMNDLHESTMLRYAEMSIDDLVAITGNVAAAERLANLMNSEDMQDVNEFVAYGMTEPAVQQLLASMEGGMTEAFVSKNAPSLWTNFVNTVRKLLGLDPKYGSALLDLVTLTEQILVSEESRRATEGLDAGQLARQEAQAPSTAIRNAAKAANKQKQASKPATRASLKKLYTSQGSTEANRGAMEVLWKRLRNVRDPLEILHIVKGTVSDEALPAVLATLTTNDITRAWGDEIPQIENIREAVDHMGAYQTKKVKNLDQKANDWADFIKTNKAEADNLNYVMLLSTLEQVDPTLYADLADALKNDPELAQLRANAAAVAQDPLATARQAGVANGKVTNRENAIKMIYEGGKTDDGVLTVDGWNKLSPRGKRLFKMVKDTYETAFDEYGQILTDNVAQSEILPGDAKDTATPKGKLLSEITKSIQEAKKLGIYFPLSRFGNHWVRFGKGRNAEVMFFESATARNVYIADRMDAAAQAGDARGLQGMMADGDMDVGDNVADLRNYMVQSSRMLKDMFAEIEKLDPNILAADPLAATQAVEKLKDDVYQLYLRTLPERDIRNRLQKRKGIAGFSTDGLRVFSNQMHSTYNQMGRLKYQNEIYRSIDSARASLEGNPRKPRLTKIVNEIDRRTRAQISPTPRGIGDELAGMGNKAVFYYMLSSIKSALVQLTQLATVGFPVLSSKYGAGKVLKKVGAYSNLLNVMGRPTREIDGVVETTWGVPDMANSNRVANDPVLSWAWQWGDNNNIYMNTYAGSLTERARMPSRDYAGPVATAARSVGNLMSGFFHHAERTSRQIMFMSSFELEYERLRDKGYTVDEAKVAAARSAKKSTEEAMFDYSEINKPRVMKHPIMRVATQFMTYPIQMTSYLIRNFYSMLPFIEGNDAKKAAASQFFGTFGMTFFLAGATGLPMYSLMMGLAEGLRDAMRDDDDEKDLYVADPTDPRGYLPLDLWFRAVWIPQNLGPGSDFAEGLGLSDEAAKTMQRAALYGPLSALTDMNWAASISLDQLFFRNEIPSDSARSAFQNLVFTYSLGAFGSMGSQVAAALDDFERGDMLRGMEKLTPAFFRGGIKSFRLATEGETTPREGAVVREAEWYHTGKLLSQSLGFASTEVADIQKQNFAAKKFMRDVTAERGKVLSDINDKLTRLISNPDSPKALDAYLESIQSAYDFNRETGFMYPITGENIISSIQARAGRRVQAIDGLVVDKSFVPYFQFLRER